MALDDNLGQEGTKPTLHSFGELYTHFTGEEPTEKEEQGSQTPRFKTAIFPSSVMSG